MNPATTAVASIVALFFILLALKQVIPSRYADNTCALCLGVSMTWIGLLIASWTGSFQETALLSLLMGSTVLGLFYTIEDRIDGPLELFRLPIYLTLFLIAYTAITTTFHATASGAVVLAWTGFGILYLYREDERVKDHVDKIIACCKDW